MILLPQILCTEIQYYAIDLEAEREIEGIADYKCLAKQ